MRLVHRSYVFEIPNTILQKYFVFLRFQFTKEKKEKASSKILSNLFLFGPVSGRCRSSQLLVKFICSFVR